jgi:NADH-quinone oxidoreductase subunit L
MTRQVWMVFFAKPRTEAAAGAKENPPLMTIPLLILALLSILGGLVNLPGVDNLGHWLEHSISGMQAGEFNLMVAGVSLVVAIVAILIGWLFYGRKAWQTGQIDPLKKLLGPLFTAFERKWWVDEIYDFLLLQTYKDASVLLAEPVDQIVIDGTANGLGKFAGLLSRGFGVIQNGLVRSYALVIFIGAAAILGYLIFR